MGAALADDDALDGGPAVVACVAGALVDVKIVLEITAAVDPVDAGALALDAILQHPAYAGQQASGLGFIQLAGEV